MHLTNYSLNKKSDTYKHTETDYDGSKRTVASVMKTLEEIGLVSQVLGGRRLMNKASQVHPTCTGETG